MAGEFAWFMRETAGESVWDELMNLRDDEGSLEYRLSAAWLLGFKSGCLSSEREDVFEAMADKIDMERRFLRQMKGVDGAVQE